MLGVYYSGVLEGVIVFATSVGIGVWKAVEGCSKQEYLELIRLSLSPKLPKYSESRIISVAIKLIRKHYKHIKWLISYADMNENHLGIIYQATNWMYTGMGGGAESVEKDGKRFHFRNVTGIMKEFNLSKQQMEERGFNFITLKKKHRYIYLIDKSLLPRLKYKVLPYPKKNV